MIKYSVVFIINDLGEILGVSRKDNTAKFGLPGGKIDDNETSQQAAHRECFEETGITIVSSVFIFSNLQTDCFYATSWEGEINTQEIGIVKWLTAHDLTHPDSAFPQYNIKAVQALIKAFPDLVLQ